MEPGASGQLGILQSATPMRSRGHPSRRSPALAAQYPGRATRPVTSPSRPGFRPGGPGRRPGIALPRHQLDNPLGESPGVRGRWAGPSRKVAAHTHTSTPWNRGSILLCLVLPLNPVSFYPIFCSPQVSFHVTQEAQILFTITPVGTHALVSLTPRADGSRVRLAAGPVFGLPSPIR